MPYVNNQRLDKPKRSKKWLIAGGALFAVLLLLGGWIVFARSAEAPVAQENIERVEADSDISHIEAKYLFSGTVVPARAVENEARQADGSIDYNQPLSQLSTFRPEQYHEWIADLECPVTDDTIPYRQQVENTIFNCRPEFLPAMSKYFTIFNLGNNHVYDRGKDKFPQMQQYVRDAGLQHVGNQDPSVTDDVCEVMAMGVSIVKKDGSKQDGELPTAVCSWHYFERAPNEGEFDVMNAYAEVMPVFGLMQVGQEYRPTADDRQQEVGRSIIDGGAEFVIGNSPHWVQNTDVYNGKLIFYSTGNFMFDQLDAETNRGANVEVSLKANYDDNLARWLDLGESCKVQGDDCLEKAKEQQLTKIRPELSFSVVASTTGYQQVTKKADESIQSAIEQRTNWQQTLQALDQQ